jgi:hypothetical protein
MEILLLLYFRFTFHEEIDLTLHLQVVLANRRCCDETTYISIVRLASYLA